MLVGIDVTRFDGSIIAFTSVELHTSNKTIYNFEHEYLHPPLGGDEVEGVVVHGLAADGEVLPARQAELVLVISLSCWFCSGSTSRAR